MTATAWTLSSPAPNNGNYENGVGGPLTITMNGTLGSDAHFTLSDGHSGTFGTFTVTAGQTTTSSFYIPSGTSATGITGTNDQSLTNPSSFPIEVWPALVAGTGQAIALSTTSLLAMQVSPPTQGFPELKTVATIYGYSLSGGSIVSPLPLGNGLPISLTNQAPGTTVYFQILWQDILDGVATSAVFSATTLGSVNNQRPSYAPTPGAATEFLDTLANGPIAWALNNLGYGAIGESGTFIAAIAQIPGALAAVGLPDFSSRVTPYQLQQQTANRWDYWIRANIKWYLAELSEQIKFNLPNGWSFLTPINATVSAYPLDSFLLYANGFNGPSAGYPPMATIAATSVPGGGIPNCTSGNCPRVIYCLGGTNSWQVGLPSPECAQVAISGLNNALTLTIPGTVPTGVFYVLTFRGYVAGPEGVYAYAQLNSVTPGSSYPVITLASSDSQLRPDWLPPQWAQAMQSPFVAIAYGLWWAQVEAGQMQYMRQLSPQNIALIPSNQNLGYGNSPTTGQFGIFTVSGSSYAAGSIQTANVTASNVQGFGGALGLQARVLTPLSTTGGTLTIAYNYYGPTTGWGGTPIVGAVTSAAFTGTAAGSIALFSIPAGRVVQQVTGCTATSMGTTGTCVIEASPLR